MLLNLGGTTAQEASREARERANLFCIITCLHEIVNFLLFQGGLSMSDSLRVFKNKEFGNIRVIDRDGEPWFVASDVCKALDIGNPSDRKSVV